MGISAYGLELLIVGCLLALCFIAFAANPTCFAMFGRYGKTWGGAPGRS